MSGGIGALTLYCEHVGSSHVHCNKYQKITIGINQTPKEAIAESHWALQNGEIRCEEHQ